MSEEQPGGQPSEEQLRAAYEAELSRITATDMILQAAVSLLNIGGHRLGPPPGAPAGAGESPGGAGQRDLEQVRDAIDGVRALLEILERRIPSELAPLRDALSRLQMAYAREMQAAGEQAAAGGPAGGDGPTGGGGDSEDSKQQTPAGGADSQRQEGPGGGEQGPRKPGPAESSGRLWVPGR